MIPKEVEKLTTPWWYWIAVIVCALYAVAGLMQLQYLSQLPDPMWTKAAYAVGQAFSAAGAFALALRSAWARWLYLISLSGFIVQRIWLLFLSNLMLDLPPYAPLTLMIVIVVPLAVIGFVSIGLQKNWLH